MNNVNSIFVIKPQKQRIVNKYENNYTRNYSENFNVENLILCDKMKIYSKGGYEYEKVFFRFSVRGNADFCLWFLGQCRR